MTKAEQTRLLAWRLRILQHAGEQTRQVAKTCRYYGVPFASAHAIYGLSKLAVWWLRLGIQLERIQNLHISGEFQPGSRAGVAGVRGAARERFAKPFPNR